MYRARDTTLDRDVALKVLPEAFTSDPDRLARFEREAKVLASLNHPNIGTIYGLEEADGVKALVLELVEGPTLANRIAQGPIPIDEALPIAKQIAEALEAAHEQGVIHRDLKPANVKVKDDGTVKVLDFGLAKAFQPDPSDPNMSMSPTISLTAAATQMGMVIGTAAYMAPEQAKGKAVDKRADVWAFGAVLFEMLTGSRPFAGDDVSDTLAAVLRAEVDWSALPPDTPSGVVQLLRRCFERDPRRRLRDVGEARFALEELSTAAVGMPPETAPVAAKPGTQAGRWNRISIGLAAATLALAALAGWSLLRPEPPAEVSQYSIAPPPEQAFLPTNRVRHLAVNPDGDWFLYRGSQIGAGSQLFLRRHDQLQATPLAGTEGAGNPAVSPDGSQIAFTCCDFGAVRLMVATIGGGPPIQFEGLELNRGGVSWGYDGYIYYAGGEASRSRATGRSDGLARVLEGGGTSESVTTLRTEEGETSHHGPHALPNGRGVLFEVLRGNGTHDVAAVDLETGVHTILQTGAVGPRYSETGHLVYVSEDGALIATPFDQDALTVTGAAVALFDGVWVSGNSSRTDVEVGADGTLIYMAGEGGTILREMVWVTRDGVVSEIDPNLVAAAFYDPALSPDGRQLAVTVWEDGEPEIWVKQLPQGRFSRFTVEGDGARPTWTRDGQALAFWSVRGGDGNEVYQRRSDGSVPAALVPGLDAAPVAGQVIYSEDGEWMVIESGDDIYAVPLDPLGAPAGDRVGLLTSEAYEFQPALSPDGRWLAYVSNAGGRHTVYVCSFPGCEVRSCLGFVDTQEGAKMRQEVFMGKRQRRRFTEAFKQETVRLCVRHDRSIGQVARELDLTESALRRWVQQYEVDHGPNPSGALTTEEKTELRTLRREVRVLREEREILKKAAAFFAKENA